MLECQDLRIRDVALDYHLIQFTRFFTSGYWILIVRPTKDVNRVSGLQDDNLVHSPARRAPPHLLHPMKIRKFRTRKRTIFEMANNMLPPFLAPACLER